MARSTKSRAEELRFIAGFLENPLDLYTAFEREPRGGFAELEGIEFVWGNIAELIKNIDLEFSKKRQLRTLDVAPKHVFHLDNLSGAQQDLMMSKFDVPAKSLSFHLNKADVLLIDEHLNSIYVSVKDESAITKLGQVANKVYGSAELVGGFQGIDLSGFSCPDEILFSDTWLRVDQWEKLKNVKDQKCAYIKRQYPEDWKALVDQSLKQASNCLRVFAEKISEDRECISQFLLLTLVGASVALENFYIVFGDNKINVDRLLQNIATMDFRVESEVHLSNGKLRKESLIIWLVFPDKKYCLTKIEPAFDGGYDNTASQTKGIQYYFQQWPKKTSVENFTGTNTYDFKQLLLDVGQ